MLPRVSRFSKTKNPISSKEKTISLVLAISHIQYFTFYTPKSKSNDLWSVLRSSVLNQKICEPAPRFQSKLNDSWSALRRSNLNQRFANHHFRSGFGMQIMNHLIWIWTMEQVCESFDPNTLRIPNLNQMICDPRSEVPIWIKRFANPLRGSNLNQMICALHSEHLILSREPSFQIRTRSAYRESFSSWNDSWTCSEVLI